jgi:transposase
MLGSRGPGTRMKRATEKNPCWLAPRFKRPAGRLGVYSFGLADSARIAQSILTLIGDCIPSGLVFLYLERFPLRLNRDSQSGRKGGVSGRDSPSGGCHMARPYSSDLRERVVEAVNEGATRSEAAERFGVGVSSAVRWHQAWRETGTVEAKPCGGSRSPLEDYAEEIIALVEDQRDRTLNEIVAAMHKRRIPGSRTALFRFLERHGITFKKSFARERAGAYGRGPRPQALDTRARAA